MRCNQIIIGVCKGRWLVSRFFSAEDLTSGIVTGLDPGIDQCWCDYVSTKNGGGCKITKAAPSGQACRCIKMISENKCVGWNEDCLIPNSKKCLSPDTSIHSCMQGRPAKYWIGDNIGNCYGYDELSSQEDECLCQRNSRGCKIKKPSPVAGLACHCVEIHGGQCQGWTMPCLDDGVDCNLRCQHPDTSLASCLQGYIGYNTNCGGY